MWQLEDQHVVQGGNEQIQRGAGQVEQNDGALATPKALDDRRKSPNDVIAMMSAPMASGEAASDSRYAVSVVVSSTKKLHSPHGNSGEEHEDDDPAHHSAGKKLSHRIRHLHARLHEGRASGSMIAHAPPRMQLHASEQTAWLPER